MQLRSHGADALLGRQFGEDVAAARARWVPPRLKLTRKPNAINSVWHSRLYSTNRGDLADRPGDSFFFDGKELWQGIMCCSSTARLSSIADKRDVVMCLILVCCAASFFPPGL